MTYRELRWYFSFHKNLVATGIAQRRAGAKPAPRAAWISFWRSLASYRKMEGGRAAAIAVYPCLHDATASHMVDYDYIYQNAWAFGCIARDQPLRHVDVGSQLQFCAMLSGIVPVTSVDLRTVPLDMPNLETVQGDVRKMPFEDGSVESLSSLCVVEHIGLGRYGDSLDPEGTKRAIAEFQRILAPGGRLYISVPVDDENRTYFNAHRAFTDQAVREMLAPLTVTESRYIYGNRFTEELGKGFGTGCFAAVKE